MITTKLTNKEILEKIGEEYSINNSVLLNTSEGVIAVPINDIVNQTYQDILLSLDRTFTQIYSSASQADNEVNEVYTGINKHRFINDLASSYIIKALKEKNDELFEENIKLRKNIYNLERELSWAQYTK